MSSTGPESSPDAASAGKQKLTLEMIDRFVQRALWFFAITSIPACIVSVWRSLIIGWRPLFTFHIAAITAVWLAVLLRDRVCPRLRATFFLIAMFALGVGALLQLGTAGHGEFILCLACMLIASMYGLRRGIFAVAACTIVILVICFAYRRGMLVLDLDLSAYLQSTQAWITGAVGFVFVVGAAVVLAGAMRDELVRSLQKLQSRTSELESVIATLNEEIANRQCVEETLRHSEARFQSLFNQAAVGIGVQTADGIWKMANKRLGDIFGYAPEEMYGRSFFELTHPDDLEQSREALQRLVSGKTDRVQLEKRYLHRDGTAVWTNVQASTVRNLAGEIVYHVVVVEDITDRRRIEDEKGRFYRETISSVTDGKLQLVNRSESQPYEDHCTVRARIGSAEDVSAARQRIRDYCEMHGLSGDALELFMAGLGEAMSNAVKHAGWGDVFAGAEEDTIWAGVVDTGPGIATFALPSATLRRGSLSKLSMGFGYSIMMNVADQITLSTGPKGTRVVLVKRTNSSKPSLQLEDLRDIWDSI